MPVKFVTSLYLPTDRNTIRVPVQEYLQRFHKLASSEVPIFLFIDRRLREEADVLINKFPNITIVRYVNLEEEMVLPLIAEKPQFFQLPTFRNEGKDSAEFMLMMCSKMKHVNEVVEKSLVEPTDFVAWIDFGVFHVVKDVERVQKILRSISERSDFPTDYILAAGCYPYYQHDDLWNRVLWKFCGGFFIAPAKMTKKAWEAQLQCMKDNLPKLTWEVNYWVMMGEKIIKPYPSDHTDLMFTFLEEEKKW